MIKNERLFFAAQVNAPWQEDLPKGKWTPESTRHITLAFLGSCPFERTKQLFPLIPRPAFLVGPAAISKELLFLPSNRAQVAALSIDWLGFESLPLYQQQLTTWLEHHGYPLDKRPFLPHVTLVRAPFDPQECSRIRLPIPLFITAIHLYKSEGNLHYTSIYAIPLSPPFEDLEHTADIAFQIRGMNPEQLHCNAQIALAFHDPQLIPFFHHTFQNRVEEIIIALNAMISKADQEQGCPFKAVSFHGQIKKDNDGLLHWEMIVDV